MKIALLGDIAFFGKYSLENENVYDYFKDVANELGKCDYVIGNLETSFIDKGSQFGSKSAHIKSIEKNVELLKYLNINIVNLANNHVFDYGIEGYENTKKILKKNNILFFGIENMQVLLEEVNNKIAFSGYCCYSTNALGYNDRNKGIGVNVLNGFKVEKDLMNNHNKGFLNIVSIHAGQENINYPNTDHIEIARILANRFPYIYYGHHPHVLQGIEQVKGSLIAYSLGNFCFDNVYTKKSNNPLVTQNEENKKSFILFLEINNNNIDNYDIIPLYLDDDEAKLTNLGILYSIDNYSKYLMLQKNQIDVTRKKILENYYQERKKSRNLEWFIKRININSVKMVINARRNSKKYNNCIKKYIKARVKYEES